MRFLLITIGSHGDIHPFLALGRALKARGHEAAVATNPYYEKQILREGLHPVALTEHAELKDILSGDGAKGMDPNAGPLVVLRDMLLPQVPTMIEATGRAIADFKPDAAVIHPICLGTRWICEQKNIPAVMTSLSPCTWFNRNDQIVMPSFRNENPSRFAVGLDLWMGKIVTGFALDRQLNRIRRGMGLTSGKYWMYQEPVAGAAQLGLWSPHFRPKIDGDPPNSTICGFPWHDRDEEREEEHAAIDSFLNEGPPPIIFSLGTAAVHTAGRFYHDAAEACRILQRRGMLLVGRREYEPRDLPAGTKAFTYAPFSKVFPRAAAIVHHGGIGTTAQGMRSGRPTVVCPLAHDQYDNAARLARLGLSRTLKHAKVTPARLAGTLRTVLEDPQYIRRAAEMGTNIAPEDGAMIGAITLERLLTRAS